MTELEILQNINENLSSFKQLYSDISWTIIPLLQTLVYIGGVIISLLIVNLFAKAWGRNV